MRRVAGLLLARGDGGVLFSKTQVPDLAAQRLFNSGVKQRRQLSARLLGFHTYSPSLSSPCPHPCGSLASRSLELGAGAALMPFRPQVSPCPCLCPFRGVQGERESLFRSLSDMRHSHQGPPLCVLVPVLCAVCVCASPFCCPLQHVSAEVAGAAGVGSRVP